MLTGILLWALKLIGMTMKSFSKNLVDQDNFSPMFSGMQVSFAKV